MDFNLSDEQNLFIESTVRYIRDRRTIEDKRQSAAKDGLSKEHWGQFAELGWLALDLPERVDGLEGDAQDLTVLMEQIGRGVFHEPIIDTPILCGTILAAAQTEAANSLLSRIATGEQIVALAHIEADGRCEFTTEVNTSAEKSSNNAGGFVLNGGKTRAFYAPNAHTLIVSAQLNGVLALFAIDAQSAGIETNCYHLIDGSHAADIILSNVAVPESTLLLTGNAAKTAFDEALDKAILADCARTLGSMELVMELTAEYLKTREQYGKPLAQFQSLQHRMADMLVETEQARSILCRTLSLFDDPEQRASAVSGAKVLISKSARWVTAQCIQLHGGIGITDEYAIGHHYKAVLTFEQRFGNSDWHLDRCSQLGVIQE